MYGMFTHIWLILMVNAGRYTSPMDGIGNTCIKHSLHMDNLHILFFQDLTLAFSDVQHMGYTFLFLLCVASKFG